MRNFKFPTALTKFGESAGPHFVVPVVTHHWLTKTLTTAELPFAAVFTDVWVTLHSLACTFPEALVAKPICETLPRNMSRTYA